VRFLARLRENTSITRPRRGKVEREEEVVQVYPISIEMCGSGLNVISVSAIGSVS
jgi:hypothetical protein